MQLLSSSNNTFNEEINKEIKMETTSRLHFGFLDIAGSLGRKFGSIGMSISAPKLVLRLKKIKKIKEIKKSENLSVIEGKNAKRALAYANIFYANPQIKELLKKSKDSDSSIQIYLDKTIPPHQGLGSGTQLALSVVSGLCKLHGIKCSPQEAAIISGRGMRSGIGIEAFARGGFIIDGGSEQNGQNGQKEQNGQNTPLVMFRHDFPKNWRCVLVFPKFQEGLSGKDEETAFEKIPNNENAAKKICHITLMQLIPGLLEENLKPFGDAIERIQIITGESFAKFQGGTYASNIAQDVFNKMRSSGGVGMGQSSWGGALYCFAQNSEAAAHIATDLKNHFGDNLDKILKVSGRNCGAKFNQGGIL